MGPVRKSRAIPGSRVGIGKETTGKEEEYNTHLLGNPAFLAPTLQQ